MLITGGLIAVAIAALLLAFFLARGDSGERGSGSRLPNNSQAQTELMAAQAAGSPSAVAPTDATPRPIEQPPAAFNTHQSQDGRNDETALSRPSGSLAPGYYDEDISAQSLNRRVYELAGQLRILQRQSQEIERHLIELSGILEGMDARGRHDQPYYRSSVPYGPDEVHKD
ncbi:hypothetical protein [Dictyobacter aurantiacus]|uniref:Uncharacterized protein n=1 Tax=Dictyobacter aurantiacus TaxID=1936993 RepID=A0A401ZCV1_9CHLR|nr:hypothetical protein [Dictyobacter aurantiacus]GCE04721.1 hypothetical protein KDAU_20500 [Dictyobacter aurantiacus]